MIQEKIEKVMKMGKSRKEPITPRRRASLSKNGGINKATKVLSRPVSSTNPRVAPACNIRVVVRVRPPNEREQQENYHNIIKVIDDQMLIFDPKVDEQPFFYLGAQQKCRDFNKKANKDTTFMFDRVFNNSSTNMEVFANSTKTLIDTLMDGCNCSVFAYGATGAGKTFTMIGNTENPGITYLTMKDLFQRKEELSMEREFELMLTYIEVYNELVKDLLNPGPPLNLQEDSKYGVMISGVKGYKINSPEDLFSLLEQGNKRRTQHPTDANAESSRSHAVFQVYIQMTMKATREVRRAKLSLIDLAGSERGSATGFVGARFKEGANINKSLLALGNCINSLADGLRHVPYRDSKLTRLLKDSLGGNCHTIMIANVSPSSMSFDDTYNTLKYATRAKKIKADLKRNIVSMDMHIDHYIKLVEDLSANNSTLKSENIKLKQEIDQLRLQLAQQSSQNTEEMCDSEIEAVTKEREAVTKERDELKKQNEELLSRLASDASSTDSVNSYLAKHVESLKQKANTFHEQMEQLKTENEELKNENVVIVPKGAGDTNKSHLNQTVEPVLLGSFKKLIDEKKELMEREFQLQCSELGMSLRRELKTEIKTRLSNFYVDSPDKDEMRRKLNEQVERYEKKEKSTNTEIEEIKKRKLTMDKKLEEEFVFKFPQLNDEYRFAKLELERLEYRYKSELKQKEIEILLDDHKDKCSIIENMASLLKPLFLAVGGKDDAPESIKKEYDNLLAALNGKKNLRWQENGVMLPPDSGLSSLTSIQDSNEAKNRAAKRKIETDSQLSLDSTFTFVGNKSPKPAGPKTPSGPKTAVNTQMMAKGFRAPAAKRLANGISPRNRYSPRNKVSPRSKENHYTKKTTVRPDTARALLNVKKAGTKAISERPRFRM